MQSRCVKHNTAASNTAPYTMGGVRGRWLASEGFFPSFVFFLPFLKLVHLVLHGSLRGGGPSGQLGGEDWQGEVVIVDIIAGAEAQVTIFPASFQILAQSRQTFEGMSLHISVCSKERAHFQSLFLGGVAPKRA